MIEEFEDYDEYRTYLMFSWGEEYYKYYKNLAKRMQDNKRMNNQMKGNLGERFVRDTIILSMKLMNFEPLNKAEELIEKSYALTEKLGANYHGTGGIDFNLEIRYHDQIYELLIEVKNFAFYKRGGISQYLFKTKILSRFEKVDKAHKKIWVVVINKRNESFIKEPCRENDIHILPIDIHLTPHYTKPKWNYRLIKSMDHFEANLRGFLNKIFDGEIAPPNPIN